MVLFLYGSLVKDISRRTTVVLLVCNLGHKSIDSIGEIEDTQCNKK